MGHSPSTVLSLLNMSHHLLLPGTGWSWGVIPLLYMWVICCRRVALTSLASAQVVERPSKGLTPGLGARGGSLWQQLREGSACQAGWGKWTWCWSTTQGIVETHIFQSVIVHIVLIVYIYAPLCKLQTQYRNLDLWLQAWSFLWGWKMFHSGSISWAHWGCRPSMWAPGSPC